MTGDDRGYLAILATLVVIGVVATGGLIISIRDTFWPATRSVEVAACTLDRIVLSTDSAKSGEEVAIGAVNAKGKNVLAHFRAERNSLEWVVIHGRGECGGEATAWFWVEADQDITMPNGDVLVPPNRKKIGPQREAS